MKTLATAFLFATVFCSTAITAFAQNTTSKPATAANYKYEELRVGSYIAGVTQSTWFADKEFREYVDIKIKIDSVDSDGNVKGEFIHSALGKGGKGILTGKVIQDSEFRVSRLQLKGSLISKFGDTWQVTLNAIVGERKLMRGSYKLNAKFTASTGNFETAEFEE